MRKMGNVKRATRLGCPGWQPWISIRDAPWAVPPVGSPQRQFAGVLGKYRLELGDGYGIHGTDEPEKLGHSVSHGCVRLGDDDIAKLYQIANVGDEVIIY